MRVKFGDNQISSLDFSFIGGVPLNKHFKKNLVGVTLNHNWVFDMSWGILAQFGVFPYFTKSANVQK